VEGKRWGLAAVTTKWFAGRVSLNFDNPNSAGNNTKAVVEQFACGLACYIPALYTHSLCTKELFCSCLTVRTKIVFDKQYVQLKNTFRTQRPRRLKHRSAATCLRRLWVRISRGACLSVCCECCVLSGIGLCVGLITRPEESY